jgi:hypothetical protein
MYLQLFPLPIQTDIIWSKTIYTSKYYLNGKELEKFQKKKQILIFYTTFFCWLKKKNSLVIGV